MSYWALNFDLDTKAMVQVLGSKTKGYHKIKSTLKELGFEHRQHSGYVSKTSMNKKELAEKIEQLGVKQPKAKAKVKTKEDILE